MMVVRTGPDPDKLRPGEPDEAEAAGICAFWNTPELYDLLPFNERVARTRTVLGQASAWWQQDRVEGKIEVLLNYRIGGAAPQGGGIRLTLEGHSRDVPEVDHVVARTGCRMDRSKLPFPGKSFKRRSPMSAATRS